jgi:hypothetical protein
MGKKLPQPLWPRAQWHDVTHRYGFVNVVLVWYALYLVGKEQHQPP